MSHVLLATFCPAGNDTAGAALVDVTLRGPTSGFTLTVHADRLVWSGDRPVVDGRTAGLLGVADVADSHGDGTEYTVTLLAHASDPAGGPLTVDAAADQVVDMSGQIDAHLAKFRDPASRWPFADTGEMRAVAVYASIEATGVAHQSNLEWQGKLNEFTSMIEDATERVQRGPGSD